MSVDVMTMVALADEMIGLSDPSPLEVSAAAALKVGAAEIARLGETVEAHRMLWRGLVAAWESAGSSVIPDDVLHTIGGLIETAKAESMVAGT